MIVRLNPKAMATARVTAVSMLSLVCVTWPRLMQASLSDLLTYRINAAEASGPQGGSLRRDGRNKAPVLRRFRPGKSPGGPLPGALLQGKEMDMLKTNLRRPVLAAFGGVLLLTGTAMTAAAFTGPDF